MTDLMEIPDALADPPLSDRKKVSKKQQDARRVENDRRAVMKGLMDLKAGRRFMHWLLSECGSYRLPLNYPASGLPIDPLATMVNIGAMKIGNLVLAEILAAAPERYNQMNEEAKEPFDA